MVETERCSSFVAILTILLEPMMVEVYFFVVIMTSMLEDKCDNDCVLVNLLLEVRSGLGNLTSAVVAHSQGLRIVN